MAWIRPPGGQFGGELRTTSEFYFPGGTSPTISSAKAHTGSYSARFRFNTSRAGLLFDAAAQVRMGVWLNHARWYLSSSDPILLSWSGNGAEGYLYWDGSEGELVLENNGSVVARVADTTGGFATTDQWFHVGVIVNCDSSSGWVSVYLDGTKILSGSGLDTGTNISAALFGGRRSNYGWNDYTYFDDFYVDVASGGEDDEALPLYRFGYRNTNGAGSNSGLTPSSGGSNYADVDELPPDGDTTYVYATSSGLQDSYNTESFSLPSGYVITAEIPTVMAKKTGTGEQLKLGFYDGADESLSAALDLTADYSVISDRQTTQPDGSAWNETDGNAMEVVVESAGSYS